MAVALKDIAERVNLSVATVSRALRGRSEIAPQTRQLVQQIAEELKYRPNQLARSILSGRTGTGGVIFPQSAHCSDFCMQVLVGIHTQLGEMDCHAICLWMEELDVEKDVQLAAQIHSLVDKRVDGFIIYPALDARETYISEIIERHIPMVMVDMELSDIQSDFVGTDDFSGGYQAAAYLINLGHTRIACLAGPKMSSTAVVRKEGFLAAAAEHGLEAVIAEDSYFGSDINTTVLLTERILKSSQRPTAIFCANDPMASSVYKAARAAKLRIPEDLSVIGFADMEIARLLDPALTTVRQNPYQIGVSAAKILIERISGKNDQLKPQRIMFRPELIIRESVGIPPM